MQIFIIGTPLETAMNLDRKRFIRQISEAKLILNSIRGINHWRGPLVEMYRPYEMWLECYINVFESFKNNDMVTANKWNMSAIGLTPLFHMEEYFINMKRRLYTKDREFYQKWHTLGESHINMYWVGEWKKILQKY